DTTDTTDTTCTPDATDTTDTTDTTCTPDATDTTDTTDVETLVNTGGLNPEVTAGICEPQPFTASDITVKYYEQHQVMFLDSKSTADDTWDYFTLELWQRYGAPTAPGTYELDGSDYNTCVICAVTLSDCSQQEDGVMCEKAFLAKSGKLVINEIGQVGDRLNFELQDVQMDQVAIDFSTFSSQDIPDGDQWCAHGYAFDTEIEAVDTTATDANDTTDATDATVDDSPATDNL
ncbi:MAG: hypothetical protein VYA34_06795, partial [Myxococcota bacterium]|nr:hypothetical protein [Myxococcota bacterium]